MLAGLQLGLGVALALVSLELIADSPLLGIANVLFLAVLLRVPVVPAALVAIAFGILIGQALGAPGLVVPDRPDMPIDLLDIPAWGEVKQAFAVLVLPQLSLTLTNAVLLTALVAGDCFGERARHVTPRRLSVTSGIGNLLLTPFGALPMCHGAGGVAAHHRFGARTGGAPLMLGIALLVLALLPGGTGLAMLAAVPIGALGALLLFAAAELALSRRLSDCRPSCRPVIAVAAGATVLVDPRWRLVAGSLGEIVRVAVIRALRDRSRS